MLQSRSGLDARLRRKPQTSKPMVLTPKNDIQVRTNLACRTDQSFPAERTYFGSSTFFSVPAGPTGNSGPGWVS
jgi:hypothetical protein